MMRFWPKSLPSLINDMIRTAFTSSSTLRALLPAKLFIAALVVLASCKKESDIGLGLQPGDELLNAQVTDTMTLWTKTERDDSVRSDKSSICLIGSNNDPRFGKTSTALYAQFLIPNNLQNITFESGAVLDSTILQLSYSFDFYGDTTSTQTFAVYRMTQSISKDSAYYTTTTKTINPSPVGTVTFTPRPRTWVPTGTDTVPAYLRIALDPAFGASLFALSGQPGLANNTNFLQELNGLYIAPVNPTQAPGEGALLHFNPKDSLTRLSLYYHTPTIASKRFSFSIIGESAYFGAYVHDYNQQADITSQVLTPVGGPYAFSEVFVHALGGLRTRINFPFLSSWQQLGYNVAINKAELVIKVDPTVSADPNLPPNTRLYVTSFNTDGKQQLLTDFLVPASNFDGNYDPTTGEYRINMAIYFQQLLNGDQPNTGLLLKEIQPNLNGRRAVLGSSSPTSGYKMQLRVTYTRVN